jgi:hypothetical protein
VVLETGGWELTAREAMELTAREAMELTGRDWRMGVDEAPFALEVVQGVLFALPCTEEGAPYAGTV